MALRTALLAALLLVSAPRWAEAASADQDFYKGKTIRVVVGFAAGGGFDTYARILARHMPKHIAGNPTMIVDNMAGAGSRLAANYLYKASAPDGLTIGNFIGSLILQQDLRRPERRIRWKKIRVARRARDGCDGMRPDQDQWRPHHRPM